MADPKVVEQPPDQLQVLFSDLFKWIPRWRDKLVIEVWSYSTFVRLGWSEEHEAAASPGDTTSFVLPGDAGDAREGGGADPACASRYVVDGRHITRLADDTETSFCGE